MAFCQKDGLKNVASFYNSRFDEFGQNIKSVGWGSVESQQLRFEILFRGLNVKGKTILDVGCGLGDLVAYLDRLTGGSYHYIGIDISERLIADARLRLGQKSREFFLGDIFSLSLPDVDIAVLSGALSFKTKGVENYARETMSKMFSLSNEATSLNFLSKYADYELEKNQHYSPDEVFCWAKKIAAKVNLIHDYPLYEFTVQLIK